MAIVTIDGIPVFQAVVNAEDSETGMLRISLVDAPAVESNFVAFDKQRKPQMYAVEDEEKRLVLGVVMRADFPIYRRDKQMGEYYIIYSAETIRTMAEKYLVEGRQNRVDLMHDGAEVDGVDMVQYFIKDGGKGVAPAGFEDIADGSLFAEFHVVNDEVWEEVKAGTYKGFSLEGVFDLVPEKDKDLVQDIVDALDGVFSKIFKPKNTNTMSKVKGLMARLARALAEEAMSNVTTDKGVLSWDGDEALKEGDSVYVEDSEGNRSAAPDGEYTISSGEQSGKVAVVSGGKVSEIKDAAAPVEAQSVATDKGPLEWNGEEDLKEGDEVYTRDGDGNPIAAADGEYTTEDGKVISVVDGKVASITDPKAKVSEEGEKVEARKQAMLSKKEQFEASYDEKYRQIAKALAASLGENFWIAEAGDNFAVVEQYDEDYNFVGYFRYSVSWNEDGTANVADPVEVKPMFVPLDFVSPFEAKEDQEKEQLRSQVTELTAEVEKLRKQPAGDPAHQTFTGAGEAAKTGNKGLDRIAHLMAQQ